MGGGVLALLQFTTMVLRRSGWPPGSPQGQDPIHGHMDHLLLPGPSPPAKADRRLFLRPLRQRPGIRSCLYPLLSSSRIEP